MSLGVRPSYPTYPKDLKAKQELAYASSKVTAIEINSTYYLAQTRDMFAFVIAGAKERNPAAAQVLIKRLA
jgi:uncharacterized protein YecE (DUF72 family)